MFSQTNLWTRKVPLHSEGHTQLRFKKDFSTLLDVIFSQNLAYISGNTDWIFMKILPEIYLFIFISLDKKVLVNF